MGNRGADSIYPTRTEPKRGALDEPEHSILLMRGVSFYLGSLPDAPGPAPELLPELGDGHHVSPKPLRPSPASSPAAVRSKSQKRTSSRRLHFPDAGLASDGEVSALSKIFHDFLKRFMKADRFKGAGEASWLDLYHHMDR